MIKTINWTSLQLNHSQKVIQEPWFADDTYISQSLKCTIDRKRYLLEEHEWQNFISCHVNHR